MLAFKCQTAWWCQDEVTLRLVLGSGEGEGACFGFWFSKRIASSQKQGQWGQCWTHTVPLRNKRARWLLHCVFLVKGKKKKSGGDCSRSCSSGERQSSWRQPRLGSTPEGSFLVRSLIVWNVVQNMPTDPHGHLAGGRGHRVGGRHCHTVEMKNTHHPISDSLASYFNVSESPGKGSWWQAWWLIGQSDVSSTALCHLQAARCEQVPVILLFSQWYIWTRKIHPPVTGLNGISYLSHLLLSDVQQWVLPPLDLEFTEEVLGSPEGRCIFPYTEDGLVRSPQAKVCKPFKWCSSTAYLIYHEHIHHHELIHTDMALVRTGMALSL